MRGLITALLLATPCAVRAQQKVPLVLNHLRIVLDSATYHDVRNSPFMLGQFAASDTVSKLIFERAGLTLIGKYNYLMLAGPSSPRYGPAGDVDIAFSVSQRAGGACEQVARLVGLPDLEKITIDETARESSPAYAEFGLHTVTPDSAPFRQARCQRTSISS